MDLETLKMDKDTFSHRESEVGKLIVTSCVECEDLYKGVKTKCTKV